MDVQSQKYEHLNDLRNARKYKQEENEAVFFEFGRWHDHSCCPDCCGCENDWSQPLTLEEYMKGL